MLCVVTLVFETVEGDKSTPAPVVDENVGSVTSTSSPETLPVTVFPTDTPMSTETLTLAPSETSTDLPTVETATTAPTETETVLPSATENLDESVQVDETPTDDLPIETDESDTPTSMPTETFTPEPTETNIPANTPTATATLTTTATSTTTQTASPTPTVTIPPTETPITPTATPTLTPFPTALSQITPAVPRANPDDEANLTITGIATSVDIDLNPVETRDSFRTGFRRLYFFIEFEGMTTGVLWRWALYRDGEFVDGQPLLWGIPSEGETFFFIGDSFGFVPGAYEMRLYLGDNAEPINSVEFTVTE